MHGGVGEVVAGVEGSRDREGNSRKRVAAGVGVVICDKVLRCHNCVAVVGDVHALAVCICCPRVVVAVAVAAVVGAVVVAVDVVVVVVLAALVSTFYQPSVLATLAKNHHRHSLYYCCHCCFRLCSSPMRKILQTLLGREGMCKGMEEMH